jgi:hypothetical protein
MTRAVGEYKPSFAFARCFTRVGFVHAWTCEIPNPRFTRRFAAV